MRFFYTTLLLLSIFNLNAQTTYTWNQATGGSWATANNWTPSRSVPANNDILVINSGAQVISDVPTQTIGALRITGNASITLAPSTSGNQTLTISSAINDAILVAAGSTLQIRGADGTGQNYYTLSLTTANTIGLIANIYGTLRVGKDAGACGRGSFSKGGANATINFLSGSTYNHAINAGTIPVANWDITSTCLITGVTGNTSSAGGAPACDPAGAFGIPPSNLNQSFGNFTWNCAGHVATINLNSQLTDVRGNLTINRSGSPSGTRVANPVVLSSNTSMTLNVGGNLVVNNLGVAAWFALSTGTASVRVNIGGNFIMNSTGSFFDYAIGLSTVSPGSSVVYVNGDLNISAGLFDWTFTPEGGTNFARLYLNGNFNLTGTGAMTTSVISPTIPNGKLIFNRNGVQSMTVADPANLIYTNFEVASTSRLNLLSTINLSSLNSVTYAGKGGKFEVLTGGTLDMGTNQILSSAGAVVSYNNAFTINSGAHLITANANGVQNLATGSVSSFLAARTFSSGANYTYNGTVAQASGIFTTTPAANTVNNLTINNTSGESSTGVTLGQPFSVNGILTLTQGNITSSLTNLLTMNASASLVGGGDNSFVNGPMKKTGSSNFTFPIGKLRVANTYNASGFAGGWRPFGISNLGSTPTDGYTAEFFLNDANLIGLVNSPGIPQLLRVSPCEYWGLRRDATNSLTNISATLYWKPKSDCNAGFYISNPAGVTAALSTNGAPLIHNRLNPWDKHSGFGSGTATDGSVTYSNIDYNFISSPYASAVTYQDFTPFAIGSVNISQAPLPVELRTFTVTSKEKQVQLDWLVNDNDLVNKYTIERSRDGKQFESLSKISAIANLETASYNDKDMMPFSGWSYYRLKITDHEGKDFYSSVQKVWISQSGSWLQVSPKPAKDRLMVNLAAPERISELSIVNNMGQLIMRETNIKSLNQLDISTLRPGMYYLRVIGKDGMVTDNFIKQ